MKNKEGSLTAARKSMVTKTSMMNSRTNQILEILTGEQRVEVSDLARRLGVSQVTIRKDLDALEQKQIITREHGCAVLRSIADINGRIAYHYEIKLQIAAKAAELVHDGDTIMLESGSCCAILADIVTSLHKNLTIITNSAFICDYIREHSNSKTILLGGIYQPDAQVLVGPMVRQGAENFWVDLFFVGTDGYAPRVGFTNTDQMRAQAVRDMAHQCEKVVVLTESEKFEKHGVVPLNLGNRIGMVITDNNIPEESVKDLENEGIEVVTVSSSENLW